MIQILYNISLKTNKMISSLKSKMKIILKLLVDDREQAVIPFFKESYDKVKVEVKRMQIGDYSIIDNNNKVLFCIERKTWRDLSASIKDGRDSNIDKMISLRDQTNCKLLLLIEGKARYKPKKKFSRIPYKNLQAKLDHLMVRDNISIIYSDNEEDTTNRLIEFCTNYLTLFPNYLEQNEQPDQVENVEGGQSSNNEVNILTKVIPKTELQIIQNIWNCVPQVTSKTSELFIKKGMHISDLVLGKATEEEIASLKYDTGTIIGKRASKILKIVYKEDDAENYKYYCSMLAEIPNITKKTASLILVKITFADLLSGKMPLEELASIKKTEKSKIGNAAAINIFKYFVKE